MGMHPDLRCCGKRCCCRSTACRGGRQRGRQRQRTQPQLLIVLLAVVVYLPIRLLTTEALRIKGDRHDGTSMQSENSVPVGWHLKRSFFLKDNMSSKSVVPVYWDTKLHQLLISVYIDSNGERHAARSTASEELMTVYWSPAARFFRKNRLADNRNVQKNSLVAGPVVRVYWKSEVTSHDANDLENGRLVQVYQHPDGTFEDRRLPGGRAVPAVWDKDRKEFVDNTLETRGELIVYQDPKTGLFGDKHLPGGRAVPVVWDKDRKEFVAHRLDSNSLSKRHSVSRESIA